MIKLLIRNLGKIYKRPNRNLREDLKKSLIILQNHGELFNIEISVTKKVMAFKEKYPTCCKIILLYPFTEQISHFSYLEVMFLMKLTKTLIIITSV
jgi:hypothetical protein